MASESPLKHPEEWPVVRLADITLKIGSGATPRGGAENYLPERTGFALIRSQNVFDRYFDYSGLAFISDAQASELQNVIVQPGDLLLNITGDGITFSRCCLVPEDVLPACVNQHVSIIRVDPSVADPGYVLDFLTHPIVKSYIESFNAGGSRRAITKGHIESFKLPLPPIDEQRAIAHILRTVDDKIELNRKMRETLEAMARALFKSWFVDFDPVRAKAEGRDTGLPDSIAALFPASFEDSELGETPQGWTTGCIAHYAALNPESWTRGTYPNIVQYVDLSNTKWGRIESVAKYEKANAPSRAQRVLRPGDTIIGTVRPGNGSYALIDDDGLTGSTGFAVLRPRQAKFRELIYLASTAHESIETLARLADGGAYPAIRPEVVSAARIKIPPPPITEEFSKRTAPLLDQWADLERQNSTLAIVRDVLLPKLITGEIRLGQKEERA